MSHLLEEVGKLYEDVGRINSDIQILEKTKEEKINNAKNKMIEFAEAQIIPVAKELGYNVYGIECCSDHIVSWNEYKKRYRGWLVMLDLPEPLQLYLKDDKNRAFYIIVSLRDGPKAQITPLREYKALAKPHTLDLDSLGNSLKEYIKKCERELFH
jgi:hypothetical protein